MKKPPVKKGKMISNPSTYGSLDHREKAKVSSLRSNSKKEYQEKLKRKGIDG